MEKKNNFQTKRIVGILFCIFLAALSWLVGTLSKRSSQQYTVRITYKDVPSEKFIFTEHPSDLQIELEGVGFSLLKYALTTPTVAISINDLRKHKHNKYIIDKTLIAQINKEYFPDATIIQISPDTLTIPFQKMKQKKVPVKLALSIHTQEDYRVASWKTFPDSVLISGLEGELDTITGIYLHKKENRKINQSLTGEISLKNTPKVHYNINKVKYSIEVNRVTQENISTRIQLLHQPFSADIKLFPEEISLLISGNVETIRNLNTNDIIIVADYKKRTKKTIPLEIYKKPDGIDITFNQQKDVEYLIVH